MWREPCTLDACIHTGVQVQVLVTMPPIQHLANTPGKAQDDGSKSWVDPGGVPGLSPAQSQLLQEFRSEPLHERYLFLCYPAFQIKTKVSPYFLKRKKK